MFLGDPAALASELDSFARDAAIFSSEREHLIAKYSKKWVAVYEGTVRAHARSLNKLLEELDELRIPRDRAIVRFIDRSERTMIL